jgi:uncharacterized membrane protein YkvA (DUF1232 family)
MIKKANPVRPWMLKKEFLILFFALKDNRTGVLPKLVALGAILYLISPIDLIPDFIPVAGWLDDIVIVPLLLNLSIRLLPAEVRQESVANASRHQKKIVWAIILIFLLIVGLITGTVWLLWHSFTTHAVATSPGVKL